MENRREITQRVLYGLSGLLTQEQYINMENLFNSLSDNEFFQFIAEVKEKYGNEAYAKSFKEFALVQQDFIKHNHITSTNSALYNTTAELFSRKENQRLLNQINKSKPSDYIQITHEDDELLASVWRNKNKEETNLIPSDIFFTKTIPLLDCDITIDERGQIENGEKFSFRVVIFEDYKDHIIEENDEADDYVGAIVYKTGENLHNFFFIPIIVTRGIDSLMMSRRIGYGSNYEAQIFGNNSHSGGVFALVGLLMDSWYSIQIALLHPTIKNIFKHPKEKQVVRFEMDSLTKKKRRLVTNVKYHYIDTKEIENNLFMELESSTDSNRKYTRKTMAWYVIGHWRKLKSGKKIFVQPTWKGPFRDLKKNMNGDDRDRIILLE